MIGYKTNKELKGESRWGTRQMKIRGNNSYNISYDECIPKNASMIILALHGFAGSKASECIGLLEKKAMEMGIGLVRFDWPGHGESEVGGEKLSVENCLSDLDFMVNHIKEKHPDSKLIAFATSFGGYLTLLYYYDHRKNFDYIILRSPAIRMYDVLMEELLKGDMKKKIAVNHYFDYGFERIMRISDTFIEELKNNNIFELYADESLNNISIIHGTADKDVPIAHSKEFAEIHSCMLYPIQGADHRYGNPGELDLVIKISENILSEIM